MISILLASLITLNGAGGSFPAPLYQKWTYQYSQAHEEVNVNYQSVGSSAGIKQIKAGTLDFAGTDAPMSDEDLKKEGIAQFPMVAGSVVPIVNLPGVASGKLVLTGEIVADIFRGEIRVWNDPRIKALNPELKLPKLPITVVHRGDGSGTTFVWTSFLSRVSEKWASEIGSGAIVTWPVGLAGQKNPGVCGMVSRVKGSIGYTELTYALEAKIPVATIPNEKVLGLTYLLIRDDLAPRKRAALNEYVRWCFDFGGKTAEELNYIPLEKSEVDLIKATYLK